MVLIAKPNGLKSSSGRGSIAKSKSLRGEVSAVLPIWNSKKTKKKKKKKVV